VVAVVGETSRGKSALVNALIGRPGISPVDPEVTTSLLPTSTKIDCEISWQTTSTGSKGCSPRETPGTRA